MRLYSPEWVDAFNAAVAGLVPETGASFRMRQLVEGGPEGTLLVTLNVAVERDDGGEGPGGGPRGSGDGGSGDGGSDGGQSDRTGRGDSVISLHVEPGTGSEAHQPSADGEPQVTVVLAYDDAVALARGDVDPATLLRAGRVKVRGNLSALVAGQRILAEAARRLVPLSQRTTF